MELKTKFRTYQNAMHDTMTKSLKEYGYGLLNAGCRTGKTFISLAIGKSIGATRILVLTTDAAMRSTWPNEIQKHTEGAHSLTLTKGSSKEKAKLMRAFMQQTPGVKIVVVNYETAKLIADDITSCQFDYVIADESQKLMSESSDTSKLLARACSNIQYKLCMTGTVWSDHIKNVYGQVRFLAPLLKGKKTVHSALLGTWGSFMYQYCVTFKLGNVEIISGYKNKEKLAALIKPFFHHVKTEDVLDLPDVQNIVVDVPMTGDLKRMYRELEVELFSTFGKDYLVGDNKLVCELRLHQMTGGFVTPMRIDALGKYVPAAAVPTPVPDKSGDAKLEALLDLVDEFGGEPFVVFTRFTADVAKIKKALEKIGLKVKQLTGAIKENDAFEAGEGDCLIANIQAGNAGISLIRARLVIDYTIGNSRTQYIQSRYRFLANGLDKSKPIVYHFLRMENSVDGQIYDRMLAKEVSDNSLLELILDKEVVIE